MSSETSIALVLDAGDEALHPLRGRVEVRAAGSDRVTVELRLELHAEGPHSRFARDIVAVTLPSAALVYGSADVPFELPAQNAGWSFSDQSRFRCECRVHVSAQLASGKRETAVFSVRQRPPEEARLLLEPETPPRLALVCTRSFAGLVLYGGAMALGVALLLGRWWAQSGTIAFVGLMVMILVLLPLTRAIVLFRQQSKLGTLQFAVEQRPEAGYRERQQQQQTLDCAVWMHPRAAVRDVELGLRVIWHEEYKRPSARAKVNRSEHACHFAPRPAQMRGPGEWRASLPVPPLTSVPPPLRFGAGNFLWAVWQIEAHVHMLDGSLEIVEMPLSARLSLEDAASRYRTQVAASDSHGVRSMTFTP